MSATIEGSSKVSIRAEDVVRGSDDPQCEINSDETDHIAVHKDHVLRHLRQRPSAIRATSSLDLQQVPVATLAFPCQATVSAWTR